MCGDGVADGIVMKGLLLNALLGVGLGRFGSVWGLPVFLPVVAAELASLQYFRRLDSARVAGGRVQSWLPRPSLCRIRWCFGWIWRRRGGWPSAASGRAPV